MFEFDERKIASNKAKHGIDFVEAQILWTDPHRLEISVRVVDERRLLLIGVISAKPGSAVFTYRGTNVRKILVRRARAEEVALYEG